MLEYGYRKALDEVVHKLSEVWIETHGAELLDRISAEEVEKAIKTTIAKKVMA